MLQVAVGVGLPSTLHKMEMVSSSVTVKSESGTVSLILRGPAKYQEKIDLLRDDLSHSRLEDRYYAEPRMRQLSDTYKIEQKGRYLKLNVGGIKANDK